MRILRYNEPGFYFVIFISETEKKRQGSITTSVLIFTSIKISVCMYSKLLEVKPCVEVRWVCGTKLSAGNKNQLCLQERWSWVTMGMEAMLSKVSDDAHQDQRLMFCP